MRMLNLNSSPTIERDLEDTNAFFDSASSHSEGTLPSSPEVLPTKNAITTLPTCGTIPSSSSFQSSACSIPTSVSNSSDMSILPCVKSVRPGVERPRYRTEIVRKGSGPDLVRYGTR
ncbi:hypothetical protein BT96DRAFT_276337 [Gymnopus androsaceus JB14]|uniref:Uncharacterized protein n=1 Tax=Gymnopus androsaceus JB14 TaxID=1447944 RepID=A0A6A4H3S4_9AGAR|nr:hypothetical protein BT96DRAFT_276337 [Gymnopus androsaceus JB14]